MEEACGTSSRSSSSRLGSKEGVRETPHRRNRSLSCANLNALTIGSEISPHGEIRMASGRPGLLTFAAPRIEIGAGAPATFSFQEAAVIG
jgi:hypothetical protein